jgi:hypothetical protein
MQPVSDGFNKQHAEVPTSNLRLKLQWFCEPVETELVLLSNRKGHVVCGPSVKL